MTRSTTLLMTGCIILAVLLCCDSSSAAQSLVEEVFHMWQKRRENATTLRVRFTGTQIIPKESRSVAPSPVTIANGDVSRLVPSEDLYEPLDGDIALDIKGGRAFWALTGPVQDAWTGHFVPFREEFAYNSEQFFLITRNEVPETGKIPEGFIRRQVAIAEREKGAHVEHIKRYCWPILFANGIILTSDIHNTTFSFDTSPLRPSMFQCTTIPSPLNDGTDAYLLRSVPNAFRSDNVTEIIVDPNKNGAVLKLIATSGGKPYFSFDIDYALEQGEWVPTHWSFRQYRPSTRKLTSSCEVTVTSYGVGEKIDPRLFEPNIQIGDLVKHGANGSRQVRTSSGNVGLSELEHHGVPYDFKLLYYGTSGIVLALAIYFGWRYFKKRPR